DAFGVDAMGERGRILHKRKKWTRCSTFQLFGVFVSSVVLRRNSHPATPKSARPTAPRRTARHGLGGVGWSISRYAVAVSEGAGSAGRARERRSGAGTHRVRYVNVSDAQRGHCCASCTSSQSRQRRAIRSCMGSVYSTAAEAGKTSRNGPPEGGPDV